MAMNLEQARKEANTGRVLLNWTIKYKNPRNPSGEVFTCKMRNLDLFISTIRTTEGLEQVSVKPALKNKNKKSLIN